MLRDLEPWITTPEAPLRQALERLNDLAIDQQFQVVVDACGHVLGTITDGDVRRAMLAGVGLEATVAAVMHQDALLGEEGCDDANIVKAAGLSSHVPFLPLLNSDGHLGSILIPNQRPPTLDTALIMAGGFGRRLGEKTREKPKPLLPVGGRPILDHILERLEGSQVKKVFLSVHYLAEQIEEFVAARKNRFQVSCVLEESPRGTAGAISSLPELPKGGLVVLNGDLMTSVDFDALIQFHHRNGTDATMAVAQHEYEIPFGVVRHGPEGQFLGLEEKPTVRHFVAAGINCLEPEFCALVHPDERMDMPELINRGREIGLKVGLFPIHEYWRDVGRPEDLAAAEARHGTGYRSPE